VSDLRISDLKQWFYCRRVVYWTYCLPVPKKSTYKMEHGAEQHEVLAALERRRELREYGLANGQRLFHVPLYSARLGLSGLLDLLVVTEGNQYFPVEFKETTGKVGMNHRYQLAGYAVLIEDVYNVEVTTGFIYRIPLKRVTSVRLTAALKRKARTALSEMRAMLDAERMPLPTPQRGKCVDCEFRRFCSDVL
jgi:CRISPR-associated exonuclease Cas4